MIICARTDCSVSFEAATHNQKFCSPECCRVQTNRRIMEKYYERQAQLKGKVRYCTQCNVTKLSRYNDGKICSSCETAQQTSSKQSITDMLLAVSWQA